MANSRYEYVRGNERDNFLLPNAWIVIRIDGRGFHRFSEAHSFTKPNDRRALELMNASATAILRALPDIILGFGISDEYSFILRRSAELFERREAKLVSTVVSTFTAYYVHLWPTYFPDSPLDATHLPTFDGRAVVYASNAELRDYVSWRQVDAHINNLYNTTFWALILKGGLDAREAETELQGTLAKDKNEILWGRFGINYNNEDEMFKKGSIVVREYEKPPTAVVDGADLDAASTLPERLSKSQLEKEKKSAKKAQIVVLHCDVIGDEFWQERPWLLGAR